MSSRTGIVFLTMLSTLVGCHTPAKTEQRPDLSRVERLVPTNEELDKSLGGDELVYTVANQAVGTYEWKLTREQGSYIYSDRFKELSSTDGERSDSTIRTQTIFKDAAPYELLSAEQVFAWGSREQKIAFTRQQDGGFLAEVREGSAYRSYSVKSIDFTLSDLLTPSLWLKRRQLQAGDSFCVRTLDFDRLTTSKELYTFIESTRLDDGNVGAVFNVINDNAFEYRAVLDSEGNLRSQSWHPSIEIVRATNETSGLGSLALTIRFDSNKNLGDPRKVLALNVRIDGPAGIYFSDGQNQSIDHGTGFVEIQTATGRVVRATDWEIERNLRSTVAYPADDPRVKALVREAIGDETDPRTIADRLAHFVFRYLKYSSEKEPLNVLEAIEQRHGDCSNFSALYVTLARSAGLPTRSVTGVAGGGERFGAHGWCETVIRGKWIPVDPTFDEGPFQVDGTHLRFGDKPGEPLLAMHKLGESQVQVRSFETARMRWCTMDPKNWTSK